MDLAEIGVIRYGFIKEWGAEIKKKKFLSYSILWEPLKNPRQLVLTRCLLIWPTSLLLQTETF